jgi:hypothetical protein
MFRLHSFSSRYSTCELGNSLERARNGGRHRQLRVASQHRRIKRSCGDRTGPRSCRAQNKQLEKLRSNPLDWMAGGSKFRDWMRNRMMPRKTTGGGRGGNSVVSPLSSSAQSSSPRHSRLRAGPFSSALRWKKPRWNVLAALFRRVAYHLLWLVESVVVVARLIVFVVRFGFKL